MVHFVPSVAVNAMDLRLRSSLKAMMPCAKRVERASELNRILQIAAAASYVPKMITGSCRLARVAVQTISDEGAGRKVGHGGTSGAIAIQLARHEKTNGRQAWGSYRRRRRQSS